MTNGIYSGGVEAIQSLVVALCAFELDRGNKIFHKNVIIPNLYDEEFIREYAVVGGLTWSEFYNSIKYKNSFYNNQFNADVFASFLSSVVKTIIPVNAFTEQEYQMILAAIIAKKCMLLPGGSARLDE